MEAQETFLAELVAGLSAHKVVSDVGVCWAYSYDNSSYRGLPLAVVFPVEHDDVCRTVAICRTYKIAITARGSGTSTTGAAVPAVGSIVMCFSQMAKILSILPDRRSATVQPGVVNDDLQKSCRPYGLFWPPDPSSSAVSTIGGNLACNAGGPRSANYGTPRDHTLRLKAVCGNGSTIVTGSLVAKSVVGFDLTRLLIGSEGTLALITEAVLSLSPIAPAKKTFRIFYDSMEACSEAICSIARLAIGLSVLELLDRHCLGWIRIRGDGGRDDVPTAAQAMLLAETIGLQTEVDESVRMLRDGAHNSGMLLFEAADNNVDIARFWKQRKSLSPILRTIRPCKINEDVGVPIDKIWDLIDKTQKLGVRHALLIVVFGHAASGNLHVNILYDKADEKKARLAARELFDIVIALNGTISGEHGVGMSKRDYVSLEVDLPTVAVMRSIAGVFDPDGILNPGKALPGV